jgi:hypothetical protein
MGSKVTLVSSSYKSYSTYSQPHELALDVCEDSVVVVTQMTVLCDSPYTFYYGNGANRNSYVCDYGDKASLKVTLQVTDDLQEEDTEIFMTMAAYDDADNLLTSTNPEFLCRDFIGVDCTKAGTYTFNKRLKFGAPAGADRKKFFPKISIAFSTKADSGYNLGAVNMECQSWTQDQPVYVAWMDEKPKNSVEEFALDYGLLLTSGILLLAFSLFIYCKSFDTQGIDFHRTNESGEPQLGFLDL